MSLKENTKKSLAEAFIILLSHKTLNQTSVMDICNACGASRQTFYYHFKDKYDLSSWIFIQDCKWSFENLSKDEEFFSLQRTCNLLSRIYANKKFYKNALTDDSQNSLKKFFCEHSINALENYYKLYLNLEELDEELRYTIIFFCHGCIGYLLDWVEKDFDIPTETFAKVLYQNIPVLMIETLKM